MSDSLCGKKLSLFVRNEIGEISGIRDKIRNDYFKIIKFHRGEVYRNVYLWQCRSAPFLEIRVVNIIPYNHTNEETFNVSRLFKTWRQKLVKGGFLSITRFSFNLLILSFDLKA